MSNRSDYALRIALPIPVDVLGDIAVALGEIWPGATCSTVGEFLEIEILGEDRDTRDER